MSRATTAAAGATADDGAAAKGGDVAANGGATVRRASRVLLLRGVLPGSPAMLLGRDNDAAGEGAGAAGEVNGAAGVAHGSPRRTALRDPLRGVFLSLFWVCIQSVDLDDGLFLIIHPTAVDPGDRRI